MFSQLKKLKPLAFLLVLSLFSTPFQLRAQFHCYQSCEEVDCCQDNGSFQNRALIVGGAAIIGGVIGAVVGSSNHHHSSSGRQGPSGSSGEPGSTGPVGPVGPPGPGFTNDPGQTLTFNLSTLILDEGSFSGTLIPFVTGPDGNTVEGPPVVLIDVPSSHNEDFDPIVINNPVFGQYQAGVQATDGSMYATIYVNGMVEASRDGSTTGLANVQFQITDQQMQGALLFSYDQQNIP